MNVNVGRHFDPNRVEIDDVIAFMEGLVTPIMAPSHVAVPFVGYGQSTLLQCSTNPSHTRTSNPISRPFQEASGSMENADVIVGNISTTTTSDRPLQSPHHHSVGEYRAQHRRSRESHGGRNIGGASSLRLPRRPLLGLG